MNSIKDTLQLLFFLYSFCIVITFDLIWDSISLNCRLRQVLLQSEEELMVKQNSELSSKGVAPKPKKLFGKMKVQGSFSCCLFTI